MDPPQVRRVRAPEPPEMRVNNEKKERQEMGIEEPDKAQGNKPDNAPGIGANGRVISYNVREDQRPGGIKVRFKIRVATGKRAKEIDARQAKAIMEVLQWQRQQTPS